MASFVLGGVTVTELNGSGKISFDASGYTGERIFRVMDPTKLDAFLAFLQGYVTPTASGAPHAYSDGSPLFCQSAISEGLGQCVGTGAYPLYDGGYKVTATYKALPYETAGNGGGGNDPNNPPPEDLPYSSETRSFTAQRVKLPLTDSAGAIAWKWSSDSADVIVIPGQDPPELAKFECYGDYRVMRHNVAKYNASTINGLFGKINSASFPTTSSLGGYAAGTLLFLGDEGSREITINQAKNWEVQFNFQYNRNGWNKVYRSGTNSYDTPVEKASPNNTIYTSASFAPLLQV
jgi:hypothetical protein